MDDDFSDLEYTPSFDPSVDNQIDAGNVDQLPQEDMSTWLDGATSSGLDFPWLDNIKSAWATGGKAVDAAGNWAKNNKELTSLFTAGVGNAQRQKYSNEQLEKMNQFKIDAEDRAAARDNALYERRNRSIIDTKPAQIGIIGRAMLDNHLAYLQGRK